MWVCLKTCGWSRKRKSSCAWLRGPAKTLGPVFGSSAIASRSSWRIGPTRASTTRTLRHRHFMSIHANSWQFMSIHVKQFMAIHVSSWQTIRCKSCQFMALHAMQLIVSLSTSWHFMFMPCSSWRGKNNHGSSCQLTRVQRHRFTRKGCHICCPSGMSGGRNNLPLMHCKESIGDSSVP